MSEIQHRERDEQRKKADERDKDIVRVRQAFADIKKRLESLQNEKFELLTNCNRLEKELNESRGKCSELTEELDELSQQSFSTVSDISKKTDKQNNLIIEFGNLLNSN